MSMSVANNIRYLRKRKGLSRMELAQMIGVTDRAVGNWENSIREPRGKNLYQLAVTLGVPIDVLLHEPASPGTDEQSSEMHQLYSAYLSAPYPIQFSIRKLLGLPETYNSSREV